MEAPFHQHLARGVELFNRQEFYEAHEAWEQGWIDEVSDDRRLLQGLIQVAAGFYKLQTGSPVGTVKLLEQGSAKLRSFVGRSYGVDLEALLPAVEAWREEAARLVAGKRCDYDPANLPKLLFAPAPA